ncbi:hypothetical protein [Engelhardtia mirabilis]|uniref:Uncharacterized protein n=1 Tax=Engelhardtia mirabilis TaxID=2528011 RepID=A0A518BGQ5_9BACT|nr:hypothetical protein Pla133_12210 [Planctomycetes bacterium Pla133]QDV00482.1 hypothetical protein Pla86_12210 [Planctomycetes bacterium Pla86]
MGTNRTPTLLLLALAALVLGGAWWFIDGRDSEPSQPGPTPAIESVGGAERSDPPLSAPASTAIEGARGQLPAEATRASEAPDPNQASPNVHPQRRFRVHVLDQDGAVHGAESGTLTVNVWHDDVGDYVDVQVREGLFSLDEAPDTRVTANSGQLGGRGVLPVEPDAADQAPDLLLVRWLPATTLRVVDAGSGADLSSVELYPRGGMRLMLPLHPGPVAPELLMHGDSPIELELSDFQFASPLAAVYARTAAHAWGLTQVDLQRGGETRLALIPGGDLEVSLVGDRPAPGSFVRVRIREGAPPIAEAMILGEGRPVTFTGMPVGDLFVTVELGDRSAKPVLQGQGQVEIVAGAMSRLQITVERPADVEPAPLAGVVVLPPGWELDAKVLALGLVGGSIFDPQENFNLDLPAEPRLGTQDEYPFDAGLLRPGRWVLSIDPLGIAMAVDLPPEGLRDVRFEVGAPGELLVRVVDSQSGLELTPLSLTWHTPRPENSGGFSSRGAVYDEERGGYVIRAPIGELVISALLDGYAAPDETVTVGPGSRVHVLELERLQGVRIVAREGEREFPVNPWKTTVRAIDHEGRMTTAGQTSTLGGDGSAVGFAAVYVDRPGEYGVTVPAIPGFLPPGERVVEVRAHELTELVIELEREP